MLCETQLILKNCWPSNLHTHPAKPHTAKPRNVTLQTIREVCVCVTSIHMCLWHGKGEKKKKKKCGVGDYGSGMRITACPFINLQSKSRFPARFCLLVHLKQHGDVEALTTMPCRFFFFFQWIDSPARKYSNQGWWLLAYWLTVCTESPREAECADVL